MRERVSDFFMIVAAAGILGIGTPAYGQNPAPAQSAAPAQSSAQPAKKNWKDRAEYDLYDSIIKEQDPNKRLALLNTWKEKYPTSDYSTERLQIYLTTYSSLHQADKVISTGNELLQKDPNNLTALVLVSSNVQALTKPTPEDLSSAEKAANALVSNIDTFFASDKKPASTSDADWAKAKNQTEALAHTTLGWISMQKKDPDDAQKAEQEFTKVLQMNPNSAQVAFWLGTAIMQEKKPERYSEALYQFARAASLDPSQGGFPPDARKTIDTYFVNAYNRYHGQDDAGLKQLRDMAKAQAFPPSGFKIKDVNEVKTENEEEFRKKNPALALWMNLKQALTAPDGEQYFSNNMKGAGVPGGAGGVEKFKGKLLSAKPALHPKELVLSISDGTTPEVTLIMDTPLPGRAEPGVELEFSGVPTSFTKEPFNVTFDVERKNLAGWPAKEAAPVHHRPARKTSKKSE